MKIFYSDPFEFPLPSGHRFPLKKYALLRKRIIDNRLVPPTDLELAPEATAEQMALAHDRDYLNRIITGTLSAKEIRRIGLPWSGALVKRTLHSVGATIQACRMAMQDGIAVSLSGGTHHAFYDRGEGFCLLNDSVIASRSLQKEGVIQRAIIIDCDVHQGNGTAALCAADPTIYTFSIHGRNNFPFHKEKSNLDIDLEDGSGDKSYLSALREGLRRVKAEFDAQLAIYLAGSDPYRKDHYGRLALTKKGLSARDSLVMQWCRNARLPVAVTMAGGYAKNIADTLDIQYETVRTAAAIIGIEQIKIESSR